MEPRGRRLIWPNGSRGDDVLRRRARPASGPQHHAAWCDELASWQYPDTWDQLLFGLRLVNTEVCVTTTPRPTATVRRILAHSRHRRDARARETTPPISPAGWWKTSSAVSLAPPQATRTRREVLDDAPERSGNARGSTPRGLSVRPTFAGSWSR